MSSCQTFRVGGATQGGGAQLALPPLFANIGKKKYAGINNLLLTPSQDPPPFVYLPPSLKCI